MPHWALVQQRHPHTVAFHLQSCLLEHHPQNSVDCWLDQHPRDLASPEYVHLCASRSAMCCNKVTTNKQVSVRGELFILCPPPFDHGREVETNRSN
ncbi:hypothetical protein IGI04_006163 [Brassica rapa subsp. trilocularis]|uniref:Uncharacterized protein n=1 Tax=Brassica rapa subsp. trilocularis TaxID=1813537 RepID=A0ABQ7NJA4_BRACM|nr:hypothetical protein IGI04_006163 [Brassica rapa subsp. trilocularis]